VYSYHVFLNHFSVAGHLGCFHSLAFVNSAAINMSVHVSLLYHDLHSFRYMPRSGITGSYGSSVFRFKGLSILLSMVVVLIYISTNSG
jgi:uncharacterized membrane protein